jgi:hypothetical protein
VRTLLDARSGKKVEYQGEKADERRWQQGTALHTPAGVW